MYFFCYSAVIISSSFSHTHYYRPPVSCVISTACPFSVVCVTPSLNFDTHALLSISQPYFLIFHSTFTSLQPSLRYMAVLSLSISRVPAGNSPRGHCHLPSQTTLSIDRLPPATNFWPFPLCPVSSIKGSYRQRDK